MLFGELLKQIVGVRDLNEEDDARRIRRGADVVDKFQEPFSLFAIQIVREVMGLYGSTVRRRIIHRRIIRYRTILVNHPAHRSNVNIVAINPITKMLAMLHARSNAGDLPHPASATKMAGAPRT